MNQTATLVFQINKTAMEQFQTKNTIGCLLPQECYDACENALMFNVHNRIIILLVFLIVLNTVLIITLSKKTVHIAWWIAVANWLVLVVTTAWLVLL